MKSFLLQLVIIFSITSPSLSQTDDETTTNPLNISGSIDLYYKYDFSGQPNIGTSFAGDQNSFSIGMLNVIAEKSVGRASFVADVALGPRNAASAGPSVDELQPGIQNLYVSYAISDKLSLTAGYMGTFVGYEVISPTGNFNYSTSYLFTNGPFQNAGFKVEYAVSDRLSLMGGVFNDWNVYQQPEGSAVNSFGGQLYISPVEGMDIYFNGITGKNDGGELDLTAGYQVSDLLYIGLNAAKWTVDIPETSQKAYFMGTAIYSQLSFSEEFSIGLRTELFETENTDYIGSDLVTMTEAKTVKSFTLSANIGSGALMFIPELRMDSASENVFLNAEGADTKNAIQVLGAVVFSF